MIKNDPLPSSLDDLDPGKNQSREEELKPEDKEGNSNAFDHLSVAVELVAGRIVLPLTALKGLAAGSLITDFDDLSFPRVQAVSSGRVFAEGELVEVGGRIGFRVHHIVKA